MLQLRKFALLLVSSVALLFGCQKGEIDPNNPPQLILDTYELYVDGGGGDISLFYAVKNSVKGASITLNSPVKWVSLKQITSTAIVLHIESSNVDEERFASISLEYPGMENVVRVNILQDKQLHNKFKFETVELDYNSCTVRYIPTDKNMPYMANVIDSEYFKQSGVSDLSVFIDTEMANYRSIADRNHMTLEELMGRVSPQLIYTGDAERSFVSMKHGSKYIVYSYGITFSGNEYTVTTPMHQTMIELPMPDMYDISFAISSQANGTMSTITVKPNGWNGYYSIQIAPDDSLYYIEPGVMPTDGLVRNMASSFYDQARRAMLNGATAEQYMRGSCYSGNMQVNIQLEAGRKYMVYVFAVESENGEVPVMRSVPSYHYL